MFSSPVVVNCPAPAPNDKLRLPDVFAKPAEGPIKTLSSPSLLLVPAYAPIAILLNAVVVAADAVFLPMKILSLPIKVSWSVGPIKILGYEASPYSLKAGIELINN